MVQGAMRCDAMRCDAVCDVDETDATESRDVVEDLLRLGRRRSVLVLVVPSF
jgi:hypothetical protein